MNFQDLIQDEALLAAITKLNWQYPTPIQQKAIAIISNNRSIVMQADTGSGKTGAYGLGVLSKISWEKRYAQCLIIAPTRELVLQIKNDIEHIGKYKRIKCVALIGKEPMAQQQHDLKQRHQVICATPGRLLDHITQGNVSLEAITHIVIDEVDELCSMGFFDSVCEILDFIKQSCQYCFCSATIDENVEALVKRYANSYDVISIQMDKLKHSFKNELYILNGEDRLAFLWKLLLHECGGSTIVFCNTRETSETLYRTLKKRLKHTVLYNGAMDQRKRESELEKFYSGDAQLMIATDIAARGLDIEKVELIINYDLPENAVRFQHRAGRSGRGEENGHVITLASENDAARLKQMEELTECSFTLCENKRILAAADDQAALTRLLSKRQLKKKKGAGFQTDITRLYLHAGKNKKLRAKDIVGAVCQLPNVSFDDIGIVEIQENGSYVEILNDKGRYVCEQLKQRTIKNHKIKVEFSHKQY